MQLPLLGETWRPSARCVLQVLPGWQAPSHAFPDRGAILAIGTSIAAKVILSQEHPGYRRAALDDAWVKATGAEKLAVGDLGELADGQAVRAAPRCIRIVAERLSIFTCVEPLTQRAMIVFSPGLAGTRVSRS